MKTAARILVTALVAAVVTACSGLVPPIAADDLFGIDGAEVDLTAGGNAVGTVALAPATSFSGAIEGTITSEGFDVPGFVNAKGMQESVAIQPTVHVVVAGEDVVEQLGAFSISSGAIELSVLQGGTTLGGASGQASFAPAIAVVRQSCAFVGGDTVCTYQAQLDPATQAIVVSATGASANAVFDAMKEGGVFDVVGTFEVTLVAPGLTASAIVTVELGTQGGQITF